MSYVHQYKENPPHPIRIPIPVPSDDPSFLERWRNSIHPNLRYWQILDFDAQYQVYWIECVAPVRNNDLFYIFDLGESYYWYIKKLRDEKFLNWQLPFLLNDRKPIRENPPPPQFLYCSQRTLQLGLYFWDPQKDMEQFLDEFNDYYDNWEEDGHNAQWFPMYEEFDNGYGGKAKLCLIHNGFESFPASMLFELGAQLSHADDTNFWRLATPSPIHTGFTLTIQRMTEAREICLGWPEGHRNREHNITKLSKLILKYRIIARSKEIEALGSQRPLLYRENIELDFLRKILAADNVDALQQIEAELSGTATDPQLINQLKNYIAEKQAFIIGANGKFEN